MTEGQGQRRDQNTTIPFQIRPLRQRGTLVLLISAALFLLTACASETDRPSLPTGTGNLSKTASSSFSPAMASKGQTIYIVWTDSANGTLDIFLTRSPDGGQTFSSPINVSESSEASTNAVIAVSGTTVYVAWEEFLSAKGESDIFFKKVEDNDGLLTRSASINLSPSDPVCGDAADDPCPSQFPTMAADGDQVLVAWSEATNYVLADITTGNTGKDFRVVHSQIRLVGSADRGASFNLIASSPKTISKQVNTISLNPSMAASDGKYFIAWSDFIPPNTQQGDAKIFFRGFDGAVFNPPIASIEGVLSKTIRGSGSPSLAAAGGNAYLVWEGTPATATGCQPGSDIFFLKSTDGFATVPSGDPINISATSCRANNGSLSVSGEQVYVVWEDNAPGLSGILFRKSTDGGTTFSQAVKLTNTGGSVAAPALSADADALYFAWEDAVLGNLEIFFSKL